MPGLIIPVWFQANGERDYALTCAELCGWGHYKMKAQFVAESESEFIDYLKELHKQQNYDGTESEDEE